MNKAIEEIWENHSDRSFAWLAFLRKQKIAIRYGLGKCVYQILGLYRFSLGQWSGTKTNKLTEK